ARVARRVFLANRDGRADADDFVNVGLVHAFEELPRVGRQALDVTPLAFGVDGVKGERRFARAADTGYDRQLVDRNLDVDVLQVVNASATHADNLFSHYSPACSSCMPTIGR